MQNLEKYSYRTKRRRVVSAVSKLLSEIECPTENTKENTENTDETVTGPLPVQTLSHVTVNNATTPDQNCVALADDYITQDNAKSTVSTADGEMYSSSDYFVPHESWFDVPADLFSEEHSLSQDYNFDDGDIPDDCAEWIPSVANDSGDECDGSSACGVELSDKDKLVQWAVKYNISQDALSALLVVLQSYDTSQINNLPKDSRTLLSTERHVDIGQKAGGDYYYFGVQYWLSILFQRFPEAFDSSHLKLLINVDGIPLFNSSSMALWPILGSLMTLDSCPFPIAVFCSKKKPEPLDDYVADFISEMQCLENVGFDCEGRHFGVSLHAVICDAPARAFLKCVKSHSGYDSCERCCQRGEWNGKVTFPDLSAELRTDSNFQYKEFPDHHLPTLSSPLLHLNSCGLVSSFPLDYMHLVCLGVMRRLVHLWICGPRSTKLSQCQIAVVSDKLVSLQSHIPRDFARKPRTLQEYKTWKATELRQFLIYSGPVVLRGILPTTLYEHFLALSVAIRILLTQELLDHYLQYAQDLLKYFVASFGVIYGQDQLVYNVHSLIHIPDDAKKYGTLDCVSAFQFETFLGRLKKLVRRPQQPCTQIVRRVLEGHCQPKSVERAETVMFKRPHIEGPLPVTHVHCSQFKQYFASSDFSFMSVSTGDNCFEICGQIGLVRNILRGGRDKDQCYVVFEEFIDASSYFSQPLDSQSLCIFLVQKLSGVHTVFPLNAVTKKYVLLPYKSGFVAVPQMHKS